MKHLPLQLGFALLLLTVPVLQAAPPPERIPASRLESLAGSVIALPDALHGKVGVLVIGFSRGSQQAVTAWGRRLAADYRDSPTVIYYEMPMLAGAPRLVRGIILRQMRASVPEPAWPRFAPLTADEKAWRDLTHYANEDDAYVLLLDGTGTVRWRTAGSPTDPAYATLKRQVAAVEPTMAKP